MTDGDDDSDSGDDPGAYVGAWGSRTGSTMPGLGGSSSNYPSSRAPLCDEDVQAHGWVPGLLLVLLQRAQEAHQRLRGDLADQNSGGEKVQGLVCRCLTGSISEIPVRFVVRMLIQEVALS